MIDSKLKSHCAISIMRKHKVINLTKIILYIYIAFMNTAFASIDDIEGAFGIKFEDVIEPNDGSCEVQNDEHICGIKPPKPYIAFDKYHVSLTSRKGVYKITGTRELNTIAEVKKCEEEAAQIIKLVSKKHAITLHRDEVTNYEGVRTVYWNTDPKESGNKDKGISIKCVDMSNSEKLMDIRKRLLYLQTQGDSVSYVPYGLISILYQDMMVHALHLILDEMDADKARQNDSGL